MSGVERRGGAPQGPPWSPDLLADLHAGVLDERTARELRTSVRDDAEAKAVLAALDATADDLAGLPAPALPADVAARLDTALDDEIRARQQDSELTSAPAATPAPERAAPGQGGGAAPVVDLAAARRRRRRRFAAGAGLLAAAAAVTGVVVLASAPDGSDEQVAAPPPADAGREAPPLALQDAQLDPQQFREVLNSDQLGALSEPGKLLGCLQANGIDSDNPLGARRVAIDGKEAQMLVLSTGRIGEFRVLTVGPECGPGNPATLADTTFGG